MASHPHGGNEQNYVNEAFDTNWVATLGAQCKRFRTRFEFYLGHDAAVEH
jgi:dTDP-4-amino-4,6-dideoxygalactose transaminase